MKFTKKIQKIWHDLYYKVVSEKGVRFALTCQQTAEHVDMGESKSSQKRIRFLLHISLCQGCKNYLVLSKALKKAIKLAIARNENPDRLESLNQELLNKYAHTNQNEG
jgi:hypothetical protein